MDFNVLVEAFDRVCAAAGYEVVDAAVVKIDATHLKKAVRGGNTKKRPNAEISSHASTEGVTTNNRAKKGKY